MAQPTTQLNATEQDTLVKQIGLALLRAAPRDWRRVTAQYRAVGRYHEMTGEVLLEDGSVTEWMATHDIATLFGRLRAGMYREGRGTWFNARYQLDHPSSYNLEYDREEPHWDLQPPPQAYVDELRMFPRSEENVPDWLMRRMSGLGPEPAGPRFRIARIFDGQGPDGRPIINRPEMDADERDRVLTYLKSAPVVLSERGLDLDRLASPPTPKVPVAYHTDGTWIWPAATNYYLNEYGIAPEADLVAHIRATGFAPADVSEQSLQAANAYLTRGNQPGPPRPARVPEQAGPGSPAAAGESTAMSEAPAAEDHRDVTRPEFEAEGASAPGTGSAFASGSAAASAAGSASSSASAEETRYTSVADAGRGPGTSVDEREPDTADGGRNSGVPSSEARPGAGAVPDTEGSHAQEDREAAKSSGVGAAALGAAGLGAAALGAAGAARAMTPDTAHDETTRGDRPAHDRDDTEPGFGQPRPDDTGYGHPQPDTGYEHSQPAAGFGQPDAPLDYGRELPPRSAFGREADHDDLEQTEPGRTDISAFTRGEPPRADRPEPGAGFTRGDQDDPGFGRGEPDRFAREQDDPGDQDGSSLSRSEQARFARGEGSHGEQDGPGFVRGGPRREQERPELARGEGGRDFRNGEQDHTDFQSGDQGRPDLARSHQDRPEFGRGERGRPGFGQEAAHAESGHPDFAREQSRPGFERDPQADYGQDTRADYGQETRPEFAREQGQSESGGGRRRAPEPPPGERESGRGDYVAPGIAAAGVAAAGAAAAAAGRGAFAPDDPRNTDAQGAEADDPRGEARNAPETRGGFAPAGNPRGEYAEPRNPGASREYGAATGSHSEHGAATGSQGEYGAAAGAHGEHGAIAGAHREYGADARSGEYGADTGGGEHGAAPRAAADPRGGDYRGEPGGEYGPEGRILADHRGDHESDEKPAGRQPGEPPRPPVDQPTTFTPVIDPRAGAPTQVQPAIKDEPEAPFTANPGATQLVPPASPQRATPQAERRHPEPAVESLRARLRDLGVPESAYRIGEPAEHGWSMEQVDAGWRVGWYDDKLTNPAVFGDPEDAAAFMLGKLLLDPRGREASPSPVSVPIPNAISVTSGSQETGDTAPVNGGHRGRPEEPAAEPLADRLDEPALGAPPTMLSPPVPPPPARHEPQRREPARPAASAQNGSSQWPIQPLPGEPPLTLFRGKEMRELPPGSELDRFGGPSGNLTYVAGTPFEERSLVPEWVSRPYHVYRVQRPLEALAGVAIPWFNQPGGGSAYLLPASIEELVADGDLIELDPGEPPID